MMRFLCKVALFMFAANGSFAAEHSRVLYGESFTPLAASSSGSQKLVNTQPLKFRAFNRTFDLELESNMRLASHMPSALRSQSGFQLLRGSVQGVADSWVRLSIIDGRYEGAIWDGSELYAIQSRESLPSEANISGSSASVIYRASDVDAVSARKICGNDDSGAASGNSLDQYKQLVRELKSVEELTAGTEIEVAIMADSWFGSYFGSMSAREMANRMNMVDGIFASQLDVNIIPTDFKVFAVGQDPFTVTAGPELLAQLANYRASDPVIRSRGLAHLLTGRSIDGDTIGIGYVDVLCNSAAGASVSEGLSYYAAESMLIIAHELGHNFGAQHDGQDGSVCFSTPRTYLMSPYINGSSTFSACSIQHMKASMRSASCIVPATTRDVSISAPNASITAVIDQPFSYFVDVSSTGQSSAYNVMAAVSFGYDLQPSAATLADGACIVSGRDVNCSIPTLAPGESKRLTIEVTPKTLGAITTTATVSASQDRIPENNKVEVPVQVNALEAASVTLTTSTTAPVVGTPLTLYVDFKSTGALSLTDVFGKLYLSGYQVNSISASNGATCTSQFSTFTCPLGQLAPQETRRVTVDLVPLYTSSTGISAELQIGNSSPRVIQSSFLSLSIKPQYDLVIQPSGSRRVVGVDDIADFQMSITSAGANAVPNAHIVFRTDAHVSLEFTGSSAICVTPSQDILDCNLGTLAAGTTIAAHLKAKASEVLRTYIDYDIAAGQLDDNRNNNHGLLDLEVRPGSDIGFPPGSPSSEYEVREGSDVSFPFTIFSYGAYAPIGAKASITLPADFTISSAKPDGEGRCTIESNVAQCDIDAFTGYYRSIQVSFRTPRAGTYTGRIEVTAANDAVLTNNATDLRFKVVPNVDAKLVTPPATSTLINRSVEMKFDVVNGDYLIADAKLDLSLPSNLIVEAVLPAAGTCSANNFRYSCLLGTLAPRSTTSVIVRVRSATEINASIVASFSAPTDLDGTNNSGYTNILVDPQGDMSIQIGAESIRGTVGQRMSLPWVEIKALESTRDAFLEVSFDPTLVGEAEAPTPYSCDWSVQPVRCWLGPAQPTGASYRFQIALRPLKAGDIPITLRARARNDTNGDNDQKMITINAEAAAPPPTSTPTPAPTPTTPASKGGGGGGGSLDFAGLALLSACLMLQRRRKGRMRLR
jgi:Metallo-peptidase family M12/Domain of unknown function DUF11